MGESMDYQRVVMFADTDAAPSDKLSRQQQ